MEYADVYLKPKRREAISEKSPWIFSGAIEAVREFDEDGQLCRIRLGDDVVATGYVNTQTNIAVRVLEFADVQVNVDFLRRRFEESRRMKESLLQGCTDAYRLIHAEGDRLPGLVVDKYGDYLVMQSSTAGIDNLRELIMEALVAVFQPKGILEKSSSTSRKTEGLESVQQVLHGEIPEEIVVEEYGMKYAVDLLGGQKTGFFLDQRENRRIIAQHAQGRTALNCYCYSATMGLGMRQAGVATLHNVDLSEGALELAARNYELNGIAPGDGEFQEADVKKFLGEIPKDFYDLIILDPPKFTASKRTVNAAIKGYKHINMTALRKIKSGGLLFTFSCSGLVDMELFRKILFYAAKDAGRDVRVVRPLHADVDHALSIYHRENEYLKGLMLYVL
ncbi:MAG: class I SAM-dependent rRNA methyltransferase [Pontiellaceae bacterium]|nr:class I SAM-dependent rRNA methyltransferase [Pontiellaceae bacterium]MBN2784052.1 class I SAM-dependent rRNA methyltransferase [Pontiellaceae bacterium]